MTKRNVLLIDDSKTIHSIITNLLIDEQMNIISHYEANTTLQFLDSSPIDLILCDINMPGTSGLQFCEALKQSKHKDIPLIFITSNSNCSDIAAGLEVGAVDYLIKPFNKEEIKIRLENHFKMLDYRKEKEALVAQHNFNEMVGILSHEINNPLFIVQGYFKKLHKKLSTLQTTDPSVSNECKKIEHSLDRIKNVLIKIREISSTKDFYK